VLQPFWSLFWMALRGGIRKRVPPSLCNTHATTHMYIHTPHTYILSQEGEELELERNETRD